MCRRYTSRMAAPRPLLGGLSAKEFLRDFWQKRPLLVRRALPGAAELIGSQALLSLAASDAVESRLILRGSGARRWRVIPGPLSGRVLARQPARNWTVLVNGVNLHSSSADALLQRFAFASWARLDDVMASYAADGGGVGPHVDSYDVFLLQGTGRRRWRLMPPHSGARGFALVQDAPLRLIADFHPIEEMTLEAGDMLYLPPGWGHDGVALGPCITYSVGFRAPRGAELSAAFLDFLHARGFADAAYRDPGRLTATHPALIDPHMIRHAADTLRRIRWSRADVGEFLGCFLSEPKQHVVFTPPSRPLGRAAFGRRLSRARVLLDPSTRLLAHGARFFINGDSFVASARARPALLALADNRRAEGSRLARVRAGDLIFDWYRQGFLGLERSR